MAMGLPQDILQTDGLKALHKYFLTQLILLGSTLVLLILLAVLGLAVQANPIAMASLFTSVGNSGSIGLVILLILLYIAVIVLSLVAFFSLVFSLRDLRRSSLRSVATYASIRTWLLWLVVGIVIISIASVLVSALTIVNTYASAFTGGAAPTTNPYAIIGAVLAVIVLILEALFIWKLSTYYKTLAGDLSQPALGMAGNLLMGALGISILVGIISIYNSTTAPAASLLTTGASAPGSSPLVLVILILAFIDLLVLIASAFFGYKGTAAALKVA